MSETTKLERVEANEVWQSNYLTNASYDFSLWEKRVVMGIIQYINNKRKEGVKVSYDDVNMGQLVSLDIRSIIPDCVLGKRDTYRGGEVDNIVTAIKSLCNKSINFCSNDCEEFYFAHFFLKAKKLKNEPTIEICIDSEVWKLLVDISTKGYIKINIMVFFSLKSSYAMRLFEILLQQKSLGNKTFTRSESWLRTTLGCVDKYENFSKFEKGLLQKVKQELDEKSPLSFDYKVVKKRKKVYDVHFTLVHLPQNVKEIEEVEILRITENQDTDRNEKVAYDEWVKILGEDLAWQEQQIRKFQEMGINAIDLTNFEENLFQFACHCKYKLGKENKSLNEAKAHFFNWVVKDIYKLNLEKNEQIHQNSFNAF